MDLPQFGFVEDLDEGERLLVAGGGVDHIDVFGTATDQRGDGHDLGTQLLHYAKVEAQLIAASWSARTTFRTAKHPTAPHGGLRWRGP